MFHIIIMYREGGHEIHVFMDNVLSCVFMDNVLSCVFMGNVYSWIMYCS